MGSFRVMFRAVYHETIVVEAESAEQAKQIVQAPDFEVNDERASDHLQDADPEFEVYAVEEND